VRFGVDNEALGRASLRVLRFSPVNIILLVLHAHLHLHVPLIIKTKVGSWKPSKRQCSLKSRSKFDRKLRYVSLKFNCIRMRRLLENVDFNKTRIDLYVKWRLHWADIRFTPNLLGLNPVDNCTKFVLRISEMKRDLRLEGSHCASTQSISGNAYTKTYTRNIPCRENK
jgi:hypothetical protein